MYICISSCKRWFDPVSAQIDITGPKKEVNSLANTLVDKIADMREIYYTEHIGSYSERDGIKIDDENPSILVHEQWHEYIDKNGFSTPEGLAIEESSALLLDDLVTGDKVKEHIYASRAYAKLYQEIRKISYKSKAKRMIEKVAQEHAYDNNMRNWIDKRVSHWAYLADELKYLLFYDLCHDISKNGIDNAKSNFSCALKKVKTTKNINTGVSFLKKFAGYESRLRYAFKTDPLDAVTVEIKYPFKKKLKDTKGIELDMYSVDTELTFKVINTLQDWLNK